MSSLDLSGLAERVPRPDDAARIATRDRLRAAGHPPGALGRLADLAAWLAGARRGSAAGPMTRVRLVVLAADDGITRGTAPAAVAARVADVSIRVLVAGGSSAAGTGREPGMTPAETEQAVLAGIRLADAEADEGTDVLLAAAIGTGVTTAAAAVVGVLAGADAASMVGLRSDIDDQAWIRRTAAVRDALRRARPLAEDPLSVLGAVGREDLAVLSGLLLQAAVRRTPVVLDGLAPVAAAALCHRIVPAAADWWLAAHRYSDPAYERALAMLALEPLLDLRLTTADGLAAVLTVPTLRTAAALAEEAQCSTG